MAGLDARIISDAPDTGYKIQLPSEIRNQTIAADLTRKKLEQARDEAHQAAARRQAAQMSDGDPERYLENLQRAGLFEDAQKFEAEIDKNRKAGLDTLKTHNDLEESQIERALMSASLIQGDPARYQAWRNQTVQAHPQYAQLLPEQYAPGLENQVMEAGKQSQVMLKARRDAIESALKGDLVAGLGGYLATLPPDQRAAGLDRAKNELLYPEATVARFRGVDPNDPQYAEKVKALTLPLKADDPVSLQSQNVMVNGKPAVVNFNPRTGTREVQPGIAPIPPQGSTSPVAVMGPDGNPVLVRPEDAIGKRPASNREQGRPVQSGDANRVADFDTSLVDLKALETAVTDTGTLAKVQSWMPQWVNELTGGWGDDAKSRNAVIARVKQVIGKALEGGVLRKEDEEKYKDILPTIYDSRAVAQSKLDGLKSSITKRRVTLLDSLDDAGFDVSKYRARTPTTQGGGVSVGQIVSIGRTKRTITKVYPDGSFDAEVVK